MLPECWLRLLWYFVLELFLCLNILDFDFLAFKNFFIDSRNFDERRRKESIERNSSLFFSCAFVVFLFPPEISILSMLFLVIGDPTAAWVGTFYGKRRFSNGKSVEGIIAFIVVCTIVGFVFYIFPKILINRIF